MIRRSLYIRAPRPSLRAFLLTWVCAVMAAFALSVSSVKAYATDYPDPASIQNSPLWVYYYAIYYGSDSDYTNNTAGSGVWYNLLAPGDTSFKAYIKTNEVGTTNWLYDKTLWTPTRYSQNRPNSTKEDTLIDSSILDSLYYYWPNNSASLSSNASNWTLKSMDDLKSSLSSYWLSKVDNSRGDAQNKRLMGLNANSYLEVFFISRYTNYVNLNFKIRYTIDQSVRMPDGTTTTTAPVQSPANGTTTSNRHIMVPIPTIDSPGDYSFDGWYIDEGYKTLAASNGTKYDQAGTRLHFYGRWLPNITFNAYGGNYTDGSTSKKSATTVNYVANLPENPTRAGYVFTGWYKSAEAASALDPSQLYNAAGQANTLLQPTELFAGWAPANNLLVTLTNTQGTQKLAGAKFNLYAEDGSLVTTFSDQTLQMPNDSAGATTDSKGVAHLYGLAAGSYTLKEDYLPSGYLDSHTWKLVIANDGTATLDGQALSSSTDAGFVSFRTTLTNNLIEVPATGGARYIMQALGAASVALALILFFVLLKQYQHEPQGL